MMSGRVAAHAIHHHGIRTVVEERTPSAGSLEGGLVGTLIGGKTPVTVGRLAWCAGCQDGRERRRDPLDSGSHIRKDIKKAPVSDECVHFSLE